MVSLDVPRYKPSLGALPELPFIDPPATSPPREERLRRAREARQLQLLHCQQWEEREIGSKRNERPRRGRAGSKKEVSFHVKDRLRDAMMRSDEGEGEGGRLHAACVF